MISICMGVCIFVFFEVLNVCVVEAGSNSKVVVKLNVRDFEETKMDVQQDIPHEEMTRRCTVGMVIDAGSSGSRLHIYKWNARVYSTPYPPISYPSTDESWTDVLEPGVSSFVDNPILVISQLKSLIEFAKTSLTHFKEEWKYYPIFFKATGGMREVPFSKRENIMKTIRDFLSDPTSNPFYFESEFARVISGEEEAIYAWAAANFLMGDLIQPLQNQKNIHDSISTHTRTYGVLDLGGASTQIAFYVPSQEILEGLYKFQIGGRKHWNIYTKSFLQFGHESIRNRHMKDITTQAIQSKPNTGIAITPCLHSAYSEIYYNAVGQKEVSVSGPNIPSSDQFNKCMAALKPLLQLDLDDFCDWVYDGECGIAGQYQPRIPSQEIMGFIGLSSYQVPWNVFQLPPTATIKEFQEKAMKICSFDFSELVLYYESLPTIDSADASSLPYYCFFGSYVSILLTKGYGFSTNHTLTVVSEYNGNRVGWTLGSILFEINALPWIYEPPILKNQNMTTLLAINIGLIAGSLLTWLFMRQLDWSEAKNEHNEQEDKDCEEIINVSISSTDQQHWSSKIVQYFPDFTRYDLAKYEEIPCDEV